MGMFDVMVEKFCVVINCFYGMILVIGLIGLGKMIILYGVLSEFNKFDLKIIIVEDFIEYCLFCIN